jgi:uncharacterized membrane protein YgcG
MNISFNEKVFDNTISELVRVLKEIKNNSPGKLKMLDVENAVDTLLNDEEVKKKISREDIIKYTLLLKDEINKKNFGIGYVKSRADIVRDRNNILSFVTNKSKKLKNPFGKLTFDKFVKIFSKTILDLSKDIVLLFFSICIVAHLRIRSFINSCYLYPSNPNRFPYVFYNKEKKEQKQILSITNTQIDTPREPVFDNIRITYNNDTSHSIEKNSKMINDMCGGDSENENGEQSEKDNLLKFAIKKLLGDPDKKEKQEFYPSIEKIVQELHGSTFAEKLEKINVSAKTFMEEHYEKFSDELSIYSLFTYTMYFNTLKNRENIGYLHNSLFKYLTASESRLSFGAFTILLYSLFKNNVKISERFVNNVLDNYKERYDGGGKIHHIFTALFSSVLAPFVTFLLMLLIIMYPLSLYNCTKSYFNYVELTNQLSTKLVCYIGMVYSVFALAFYVLGMITAIFPEFFAYMAKELKHTFGGSSGGGGSGGGGGTSENDGNNTTGGETKKEKKKRKKQEKKEKRKRKKQEKKEKKRIKKAKKTEKMKRKVVSQEETRNKRKSKKNEQKERLKEMKKGKEGSKKRRKYDKQKARVNRSRKRIKRKDKKIKKKGKKVRKREGFAGEKGCSSSGFFKDFNVAKLFGLILLSILGIFVFFPVVIPFICAFMSSFGIASSLSFDAIKFMGNNLCSIKNYSSIIKILVSIVLIHQILDYNSYGKKHTKRVTMIIYIIVLVIYLGIESLTKPTEKYLDNNCKNK